MLPFFWKGKTWLHRRWFKSDAWQFSTLSLFTFEGDAAEDIWHCCPGLCILRASTHFIYFLRFLHWAVRIFLSVPAKGVDVDAVNFWQLGLFVCRTPGIKESLLAFNDCLKNLKLLQEELLIVLALFKAHYNLELLLKILIDSCSLLVCLLYPLNLID